MLKYTKYFECKNNVQKFDESETVNNGYIISTARKEEAKIAGVVKQSV